MIFKNNYIIKEKVLPELPHLLFLQIFVVLVTQKKLCIKIEKNSSSTLLSRK